MPLCLMFLVWTIKLSFCTDCWRADWNVIELMTNRLAFIVGLPSFAAALHHQHKSPLSSYNPWSAEKIAAFLSLISLLHAFSISFFLGLLLSGANETATIYYSMEAISKACVIKHFAGKSPKKNKTSVLRVSWAFCNVAHFVSYQK